MDPFFLPAIIEQALSAVVVLIIFGSPLALIYLLRSFRLREKELDLRRALAERPRDEEIAALDERVARLERDRAFFERLADGALRGAGPAAAFGARVRAAEPFDALAALEAAPDVAGAAARARREGADAR